MLLFKGARRRAQIVAAASAIMAAAMSGSAVAEDIQPNIIGGQLAEHNPAVASLQYDAEAHGVKDWHTCGANLFAPGKMVTAAHCVTDPPSNLNAQERAALLAKFGLAEPLAIPTAEKKFHVRYGTKDNDRTAGGIVANVTKITVHDEWDWGMDEPSNENVEEMADLAVLHLDKVANDIQPLEIPVSAGKPGTAARLLGWGIWSPGGRDLPRYLQQLDTKLLAPKPSVCGVDTAVARIGDLCVSNVRGYYGVCYGDSGTGAFEKNAVTKRYDLIGVASRIGHPVCGRSHAVYTNVAHYHDDLWDMALGIPLQRSLPKVAKPVTKPTVTPEVVTPTLPFERP